MDNDPPPKKRPRGIYLLPNLFTTAGLFSGFYAIVAAMGDRFEPAAIAIFVAMIMDGIDGRVARLTHTQSDFGVQYDSLSDMVCFGLAPALVVYQWALRGMAEAGWMWAKLGWLVAFVYAAAAALRLARFNAQVEVADKRYFQGLPSPSAAAVVAGLVWVGTEAGLSGQALRLPALLVTLVAGLLMVSNFRYYSFKELDFKNRVPFVVLLVVVLGLVFVTINPPTFLFVGFLIYVLSGPVLTIWQLRRRRLQRGG
ncbi:phosphatidylcholine/phosphatidylserine synthase [Thiohalobacter sp. IOR34]|uniref:CDP-alcohol phosphatidyltransferase family protein n=1 Tax=Thiohalobacter sp. IOR34 TaxID=3057176 RepID=UPI0025B27C2F|nr:phosphatidylcholine/phosphatidylserine synthase [Thiohalobacter sp. IOR34]WJW76803.1 phosphatidylcholine/phosphatidylserine synthase [Thiohalobacter sp. IOR34]